MVKPKRKKVRKLYRIDVEWTEVDSFYVLARSEKDAVNQAEKNSYFDPGAYGSDMDVTEIDKNEASDIDESEIINK